MSKPVQILLTKELTVNLGKDADGQQNTVTLPAGLQEVSADIANHWFVKAHAQEITLSMEANKELQDAFDALSVEHEALKVQCNTATLIIVDLQVKLAADAKTIADLQKQIASGVKTQSEPKPEAPKGK